METRTNNRPGTATGLNAILDAAPAVITQAAKRREQQRGELVKQALEIDIKLKELSTQCEILRILETQDCVFERGQVPLIDFIVGTTGTLVTLASDGAIWVREQDRGEHIRIFRLIDISNPPDWLEIREHDLDKYQEFVGPGNLAFICVGDNSSIIKSTGRFLAELYFHPSIISLSTDEIEQRLTQGLDTILTTLIE